MLVGGMANGMNVPALGQTMMRQGMAGLAGAGWGMQPYGIAQTMGISMPSVVMA